MTTVGDWMSSPIITIDPDSCLAHALTLMRRTRTHSLLVEIRENGLPEYGIITSSDVGAAVSSNGTDLSRTTIRDVMSSPVVFARPEWSLQECSQRMMEHAIHHMPVWDGNQNPVGMISATDIFIAVEERGWS